MKKLKIKIIKFLESTPIIGNSILYLIRKLKLYFYYKPKFFFNSLRSQEKDIFKVFYIDPNSIQFISQIGFQDKTGFGKAKAGNWDLENGKFDKLPVCIGLRERFEKKFDWENTEYFKIGISRIKKGDLAWMCKNEDEFQQRLKNVDGLFEHIKANGFKEKPEDMFDVYSYKNKSLNNANEGHKFFDYVTIDISRTGVPLFVDGRHRLIIAKILKLEQVPVIIRYRHKKWMKLKQDFMEYTKNEDGSELYQKAYHFDLENIPYRFDESRINDIKKYIGVQQGSVLDIGAFFGLNSHEMEREGFECTAVESNLPRIYFMKKLREANHDQFHIVEKSIFEYKKDEKIPFDIILALYIFHHFLKTKQDYKKLIHFLARLECKEMFLGVHNPEEFKDMNPYKNYTPDEFSDFILENSCLKKKEVMTDFENGRRLYKLSV